MTKPVRWLAYGAGGILLLALAALAVVYGVSQWKLGQAHAAQPSRLAALTPDQRADAQRHLYIGGCASCHGADLGGRKFLDVPGVATIYAPNLTTLAKTMSDAQLDAAVRQGIGHDGRGLLIMPSRVYQFMTDVEAAQIVAAIRATPTSAKSHPASSYGPLFRLGMVMGDPQPQPAALAQYRDRPLPGYGAGVDAGRHLVQTTCAECHGYDLKGATVGPDTAPSLNLVAGYDATQFASLLRTGVPPSGKSLGLMKEVAISDFSHFTDEEVAAIYAYLDRWAAAHPDQSGQ